jgi:hypothetical protein
MTNTLKALALVEKAEPVQAHFTLRSRDQQSSECRVYMDSYMASNGSCFMVTWIVFQNHLLKVGLTENQETMTRQKVTTIDCNTFYHVGGPLHE